MCYQHYVSFHVVVIKNDVLVPSVHKYTNSLIMWQDRVEEFPENKIRMEGIYHNKVCA